MDWPVSIHAPAWGATLRAWKKGATVCCFNPRARMGRDPVGLFGSGARECFNPRARMGRDIPISRYKCVGKVSIHAPAWGATG
ncbi:hypothetical protein DENIS_4954 [Desulfonema ishimotonii]|uniref:Uncharacterized protein n=1 Tax=Desulfonema ishimotonii TaxID=45657 RepID=A0A401G414_9BACT|nr:hypothetical protein DENIS_4954 [Desulfonema ishimotonii]